MRDNCNINSRSLLQKPLFLVLLTCSLLLSGFSQDTVRDISAYNSKSFKEELFLQTDRDLYIVGEQVWFKVIKLNALSKKPENVSKVVYIELLNRAGYPVRQIKLNVEGESESAGFSLSDTLSSGNYLLRAYTNWMKNYSEKEFSFKTISIINPFQKPEKIGIPSMEQTIDTVLFYPEGGEFVSGIESKVGFRAIDKSGTPQKINGAIVNDRKDTLCLVRTEDKGFGTFIFKPDQREDYRLLYTNKKGEEQSFPMGAIEGSGSVLAVDHSVQNAPFRVRISKSSEFQSGQNRYFILIASGGIVNLIKEINLDEEHEFEISKNKLPEGISQIALVNDNQELISSRWICNQPVQSVLLDVKFDKPSYGSREQVKATINATDSKGDPVYSDLTVSVIKSCAVNKDRLNLDNRYNCLSSFHSGICFDESTDLNDLLLFYSCDEFDLNEIMDSNKMAPRYLPELGGIILNGTLRDNATDEPVGNQKVMLSIVGKGAKCQVCETNDSGYFHFNINESGLQEIIIQPIDSLLNDYYVELESDFSNSFDHCFPGAFYPDTSKLEALNNAIISMQVENIYKPFRQINQDASVYSDSVSFYGEPEFAVQISDYIRLTTVREVIYELIPSAYTRRKGGKSFLYLINAIDGRAFENNPLVIVDGIPFDDISQIIRMNSTEMERIEVLNLKYFIDDHVFDGIIHFVTNKGNLEKMDFDHIVFRQAYTSFYREDQFNAPDYSSDALKNSPLPDFRNTLYWNPDLRTQNDGVVGFEFFTSDEAGDYTILIEGISRDGKTGTISKQLIVN